MIQPKIFTHTLTHTQLGGGFIQIFQVSPQKIGEMIQFEEHTCFKLVVLPPTST